MKSIIPLISLIAIILIGCAGTKTGQEWHQLDSGLKYKIIEPGTGQDAERGDKVSVHYVGTLEDGTEFDNSYKRNRAFTFTLGSKEVIEGWDIGVEGMRVGEKRHLIIPSQLAYGDRKINNIPPNSTLVFTVELLDVK